MSNRTWLLAWSLPILLTLGACKKELTPDTPKPVAPAKRVRRPHVAGEREVRNLTFNYLQIRGKMQLDDGQQKLSSAILIRMKYDSIIWVSVVPALGIEVARVRITRDSVLLVNKLQKTYFRGDFPSLQAKYQVPIDFKMLQDALVANYVPLPEDQDLSESFDTPVQTLHHQQGTLLVDHFIDRENLWPVKLAIRDQRSGNALTVDYVDFKPLHEGAPADARAFPYAALFSIQQAPRPDAPPEELKNILISLDHKTVSVPAEKLDFSFEVPANYERVK